MAKKPYSDGYITFVIRYADGSHFEIRDREETIRRMGLTNGFGSPPVLVDLTTVHGGEGVALQYTEGLWMAISLDGKRTSLSPRADAQYVLDSAIRLKGFEIG